MLIFILHLLRGILFFILYHVIFGLSSILNLLTIEFILTPEIASREHLRIDLLLYIKFVVYSEN